MRNHNIKVVLIEDDVALGQSMSEILVISGIEVKWLKEGGEALLYLKKYTPEIIISDLMMPIMNGEELFFKIRQIKKFNTIPFIIITANRNDSVKFKQLQNGVNDFIMKPFKAAELVYKIKNVISLKDNFEKKYRPDPFSKVTIKLSEKDFLTSLNEILSKSIKSKVELDKLCNELFISKSTLDKRIRKLTSKNVSQYIREFKLDYAIKLMYLGERNIQFLVDETGFNSFSYFSTSFKLYMNLSPRDFIKSIQNDKKQLF